MAKAAGGFPTFTQPVDFSDVVLVVEGRSFHVHKAILAKWSPVFKAMLTSDFKERSTNRITLPNKKACDVLELLQVLYPPEKPINSKNVKTILCLAREYQIQCVTNRCEKSLLADDDLGLKTLAIADEFQLQQLLTASAQAIAQSPLEEYIWPKETFQKLEAATKLAVVKERLDNVSFSCQNLSRELDDFSRDLPVCQEWLCDVHTESWKIAITQDYERQQEESKRLYECSSCQIPNVLQSLFATSKRIHEYHLSF